MKHRKLGKTGLDVSVIGVGTWQFGGEWGKDFAQDEVDRMMSRARDLGINLVDTAECYGDHLSESLVGRAIARDRAHWIIASKFGHRFHGHMKRTDERSVDQVRVQLEASLKALGTDYIDVYQFHSVKDGEFNNPDLWAFLQSAQKAGKIRFIGNSISPNTNVFQTDLSGPGGVSVIQVVYNRLDRAPEQAVLPSCQKQDLGVLARVPLASGLLSGKYKPGQTHFAANDYRSGQDPAKLAERLREVERIAQSEVPAGVNMAQWALAWCLENPAVSAVIPGCKDVKQVESNAAAADLVG